MTSQHHHDRGSSQRAHSPPTPKALKMDAHGYVVEARSGDTDRSTTHHSFTGNHGGANPQTSHRDTSSSGRKTPEAMPHPLYGSSGHNSASNRREHDPRAHGAKNDNSSGPHQTSGKSSRPGHQTPEAMSYEQLHAHQQHPSHDGSK